MGLRGFEGIVPFTIGWSFGVLSCGGIGLIFGLMLDETLGWGVVLNHGHVLGKTTLGPFGIIGWALVASIPGIWLRRVVLNAKGLTSNDQWGGRSWTKATRRLKAEALTASGAEPGALSVAADVDAEGQLSVSEEAGLTLVDEP